MADNAVLCLDNSTAVDVYFNGLNIGTGSVVSAWNDTDPQAALRSCITLTGDTDEPSGSVTAITQYNSCYECLIDNYTTVSLELCSGTTYTVDLSNFGGVPNENDVFFLELTTTGETIIGCFTVTGVEQNTKEEYEFLDLSVSKYLSSAPFPDCETCKNGFSAGTESTACNICWDGTGYTATVVSVPHPSYTNQFGQTVVQLDAIQLGGMNGLNN